MANSYDSAHLRAEQSKLFKFSNLSAITKNHLHEFKNLGYINFALAKSSVRIGTLNYSTATHDALSVYFCVNACAYLFIKSFSMVALVGQPKGWLDSVGASSSNPANVTAYEIGTSSGDYNNQPTETVIMTNILISILSAPKLFKFSNLSAITKNHLHEFKILGYINFALAKSSVRIETLFILLATHDALRVFFCVNAYARLFIKSFSMVALVGHPKGWLASSRASSLNPANVTANEIETSSGDYLNNYLLEAVIMTTTPSPIVSTQKLFKFYDLSTNQVSQTIATIEQKARMMFLEVSKLLCVSHNLIDVFTDIISNGGKSNG